VLNPSSQPACMSERILGKETDRPTIWKPKGVNEALQLRVNEGGHGLLVVPVAQLPASS
jgi:hypothetical protein